MRRWVLLLPLAASAAKQPAFKQLKEEDLPPGTKVKTLKEGDVLDLTGGEYERSKDGVSPAVQQMFDAIDTNDPKNINAALGSDIDINIRGPHGYTPLFLACVSHRHHAVRLLLDRGADVRKRDTQGFNPLDAAAFSGCAPCARMLLEHGMNPHVVHRDGFNALHRAIWGDTEGHTRVVELLLKAGVSATKQANVPEQGLVNPIDMVEENQATKALLEEWIRKDGPQQCDSTSDAADAGSGPGTSGTSAASHTPLSEQQDAADEAELDAVFKTSEKDTRRARRRSRRAGK